MLFKTMTRPCRFVHFEYPCRMALFILITVGNNDAVFCFPEEIIEFSHWASGTHPAEPVTAPLRGRGKQMFISISNFRVDPVRDHNDVTLCKLGLNICAIYVGTEDNLHAKFNTAVLKDAK